MPPFYAKAGILAYYFKLRKEGKQSKLAMRLTKENFGKAAPSIGTIFRWMKKKT